MDRFEYFVQWPTYVSTLYQNIVSLKQVLYFSRKLILKEGCNDFFITL